MNIILYTTHCPNCKVLQKKLQQINLPYQICEDIQTMEKLNILSVPCLQVDDKILPFGQAVKWLKENC